MFDFFGTILWPIKWVIEAILVAFHWLITSLGMDPDAGLTWVLAIVGVVLVVRADKTLRDDIRRSAKQIGDVGGWIAGIIVNEINTSDRGYYSYSYGYAYGYGSDEEADAGAAS